MVKFSIKKLYDALQGRYVREVKANDIFHIATSGTISAATAGTILVSGTTSANHNLYITALGMGVVGGPGAIVCTVGTSTILPVMAGSGTATHTLLTSGNGEPLYKVDASQTVSIRAYMTGTYTAFLSAIREPTFTNIETA